MGDHQCILAHILNQCGLGVEMDDHDEVWLEIMVADHSSVLVPLVRLYDQE